VPWCEECAKYYTPNSVNEDGSCPACGEALQLPEGAEEEPSTDDESTPWHFKLMVVAVVAYLGWRLIQLFA
jgi:transcription initiation factor IIE alpha subunit